MALLPLLLALSGAVTVSSSWSSGGLSRVCGSKTLPLPSGEVTSPMYPLPYPPHTDCKWTIPRPENGTLVLRLVDLDIEDDNSCQSPPCCVHNWLSFSSSTQLCGKNNTMYNDISLPSRSMSSIKFHTSKVRSGGRGFRLVYFVCGNDEYACKDNTKCVSRSLRCNGVPDCQDGSDEVGCAARVACAENEHRCIEGTTCVDKLARCNGLEECPDGSDEWDCKKREMREQDFSFAHSILQRVCNNENMIPCDDSCYLPSACTLEHCKCFHPTGQKCDGKMDCPNGIDEISCKPECENKIACAQGPGCYTLAERCDGYPQCSDSSDEYGCNEVAIAKFECNSGKCIDNYLVCNEDDDCGDGSDENNCIRTSMITAVVIGSAVCGVLAVVGVATALRTYSTRNRRGSISTQSIVNRLEDQEPLDEGSLYHLYREPPPSYQEAILQGASPPPYWQPSRFPNSTAAGESSPQPSAPPSRFRSLASRSIIPKSVHVAKPTDSNPSSAESDVISADQPYPENGGADDSDTTMLELSDSNIASENCRSQASSPDGTSCSNLMLLEPVQDDQ